MPCRADRPRHSADPGAIRALRHWAPDLLMVTPMIDFTYGQTDYVKAARASRHPELLAVASWDNLTNKGLIQIAPDRVLLWNAAQEREAVTMHAIPAERVRKTGAQLYDHWFEMKPTSTAPSSARAPAVSIRTSQSSSISAPPHSFAATRSPSCRNGSRPRFAWKRGRDANVIVRPHPAHLEQWQAVDLSAFGNAVIWPRAGGVPVDDERKRDYFDSLFHADAVVGINTSGFIEAGILAAGPSPPRSGHFDGTQEGTLHFRYLTEPLLTISPSFASICRTRRSIDKEKTKTEVRTSSPTSSARRFGPAGNADLP